MIALLVQPPLQSAPEHIQGLNFWWPDISMFKVKVLRLRARVIWHAKQPMCPCQCLCGKLRLKLILNPPLTGPRSRRAYLPHGAAKCHGGLPLALPLAWHGQKHQFLYQWLSGIQLLLQR